MKNNAAKRNLTGELILPLGGPVVQDTVWINEELTEAEVRRFLNLYSDLRIIILSKTTFLSPPPCSIILHLHPSSLSITHPHSSPFLKPPLIKKVKAQFTEQTSTKGCFSLAKYLKKTSYHDDIQFVPELKKGQAVHVETIETDYLTEAAIDFMCASVGKGKGPDGCVILRRILLGWNKFFKILFGAIL